MASEMPSTSTPLNLPSRLICRVCEKQFSKYTCPRCNAHYCSLGCYKSHSVGCTESFMRENVVQELRQLQTDDESKQKMLDILKRVHGEEEDDDEEDYNMDEDDSTLSEETIQSIQSGRQVDFDDLSSKEKKYFLKALSSGELSKLIQPWEPWWLKPSARTISLNSEGMPLIQPLPDQNNHSLDIPVGPTSPLKPISKLISSKPSPLLAVHLVDVIYSYCFTLRLYNGDWQSDPLGSSMVVLNISSVLDQRAQPETVREALSSCLEKTCSPAFRHVGGLNFGLGLVDDVVHLLSLGSNGLICMLCDLERLLRAGLKLEKQQKSNKLKLAVKKVYFIMCWVHEQSAEAWSSLAAMVGVEKASASEFIDGGGSLKVSEMKKTSRAVIEELQ
ncbi:zinc finger HIT domain-containing protein 2 [Impatiens glandulifera]|uniref:zinc finger HIT domain-containing protein 2 n=1 Tax=Impatiens glandulifera TaxID=253017 RepID=UPI001FB07595|nr:zinc finger HIT domain-containing protein 2 [Impatiens glandulifera]